MPRPGVNCKLPDIFVWYLYLYVYLFKVFVHHYIYMTIFSSSRIFVHRRVIARPGSSVNSKFPGVGNEKEEKLASAFRWKFTWLQDLCTRIIARYNITLISYQNQLIYSSISGSKLLCALTVLGRLFKFNLLKYF